MFQVHYSVSLSLKVMFLILLTLTSMGSRAQSGGEAQEAEGKARADHHTEAPFYLGLRSGFLSLEDVDDHGSFNLGLVGGYYLNPHIAFEGSVDYQETDFVFELNGIRFPVLERETVAFQAGVKLLPLSRSPIRPFLTGGLGHYLSDYIDSRDLDPEEEPIREKVQENGFYVGCGLDLFPRRSTKGGFSFTWDTRWMFTEKETYRDSEVKADGWNTSFACNYKF